MYRFKHSLPLTLLVLLISALLLTACGKDEDRSPAEAEAVDLSTEHSAVLAHAPADSAFLVANLEPVPEDLVHHYIEMTSPMIREAMNGIKKTIKVASEEAENPNAETQAGSSIDDVDKKALSLMQAVVTELDGKYTPEGLQSLGLSLTPRFAIYEQDLAPVVRLEIADRAALEAVLNRIADNAGVDIGGQDGGNATYWQFPLDEGERTDAVELQESDTPEDSIDSARDGAPELFAFIAITDRQLVASLQPQSLEAERLPQLLATQGEFGNAAAERINAVNDDHGLLPYGTTMINVNGLLNKVLESDSTGSRAVREAFGFDPDKLDTACVADFRRMFVNFGEITGGYTRLDRQRMDQYGLVELTPGLAQDFQGLTNPLPALNPGSGDEAVVAMRFGINLIALRDWMKGVLDRHAENPFVCEDLQDANQQLAETRTALNRPVPPFISNWRGIQLSLDSLPDQNAATRGSADMMQNFSGLFSLYMENPQMLLGMAQMFVPQLAEIKLQPNGEVTALPREFSGGDMNVDLPPSWAAMTDQLLAVAFGESRRQDLPGVVNSEPVNDGTVLEVEYDYALYAETMAGVTENMMTLEGDDSEEARKIAEAQADMLRSYAEVFERIGFSLRFTEQGIQLDQRTHLATGD